MAGADPTLTDRNGNTVLHLASQQEAGGMVMFLLQHQDVRRVMEQNNTAGTQQPFTDYNYYMTSMQQPC